HSRRRHRDPELAVLDLLAVCARARRGWTRVAGDGAAAPDAETVCGSLSGVLSRLGRGTTSSRATSSAAGASARRIARTDGCAVRIRPRRRIGVSLVDDAGAGREMLLDRLAGLRVGANDFAAVGGADPDRLLILVDAEAARTGAFRRDFAQQ